MNPKKKTRTRGHGQGLDLAASTIVSTLAMVVHIEPKKPGGVGFSARGSAERLAEAVGLTKAIELNVVEAVVANLSAPRPSTLLGEGKVSELGSLIAEHDIGVVIINAQLSPIQQRNLEREWKTKVLDRTGLILEIFGRRAATREGSLQVELAHLQYQRSRLVRSWTHLERQRGGFGFLGGPGESQLEADRRLIQERIARIERDLAQAVKTRELHRKGRARVPYPVVAFVGYTNAGKSTLFNRLSSAQVLAKDMLFATLDPTMRQISLPKGRKVIVSDTVGFISDLPTTLIAAFRATLEEVIQADVILHVRDISHPETDEQAKDVLTVLDQLGIDDTRRAHMIEVWNKADLLDPIELAKREMEASRSKSSVLVSALDGSGVSDLMAKVEAMLSSESTVFRVSLDPGNGKDIAWLHERGEVLARKTSTTGKYVLDVRLDEERVGQARAKFGRAMRKA